ncbi:MAG: SDR family NAD(P)-dependent oxidoreductase [Anaerolineae bacterium]|nr:SDR family NAD(P)-dependent oxidoreductase [Anaerolineae bacterium]
MDLLTNPVIVLLLVLAGIVILSAATRALRLYAGRDYFKDKVVILTGASRGIGRELALALAKQGAHLVLAARSADQLDAVAKACRDINATIDVITVPTDVTDEAQLTRLIKATLNRFGRIDILLSNAGILQGGVVAEMDFNSIRRQIEVNLIAGMRLVQLVLPPMLAQGEGHVVLMASAGGRHSMPYITGYCASKHGLVGFGEGLRREVAGKGIGMLTVKPGFAATDMVTSAEPAYRKMGFQMIPPERIARRTLAAVILGRREITIGLVENVAQWSSATAPVLGDLFWRLFMPAEFPELLSKQKTE